MGTVELIPPPPSPSILWTYPLVEQIAALRFREWSKSIGEGLGKVVVELSGEAAADLKLLDRGQVIVATAQHWDALSRRWKQRKNVQVMVMTQWRWGCMFF